MRERTPSACFPGRFAALPAIRAFGKGFGIRGILPLVALLGILATLPAPAQSSVISSNTARLLFLGNKNIPPVVYLENGVPSGVAADLVRAVAAHLSRPVDIQAMDWSEAQALVARGQADALIQINPTEERRKTYEFSDPLLESQFSIFTGSDRVGISSLVSLRGQRVGVEAGGLPRQLIGKDPQVRLTIISNFLHGFTLLRDGEVDAVVVDFRVGSYVLAENKIRGVKAAGSPVASSWSAIAVRKGNSPLLDEINRALRTLHADGTYDKVIARWKPKEVVFWTREQITGAASRAAIAALAVLVVLALAGYWLRVRNIERRSRELERLVAERTRELQLARDGAESARRSAETANQAKSVFLASMSHELRTPLNAILGYAQILKPQPNLTPAQRRQLDVMHASGEHLLTLINDILDLSKIESQKIGLVESPFNLPRLLHQIVEITRVKAGQKMLRLECQTQSPLPECVRGDECRIRQILLNLMANAVKYTRQGGVTLRVRYEPADGGSLHCEVADTGIGIPADKIEAIFEPFVQLAPESQGREGVGLGLTITRRLTAMMGGTVTVESRVGVGSTFRFSMPLPAADVIGPVPEQGLQNVRGYRGARKRVMVVDDDTINTELLTAILEPLGFEVRTAGNGRDALEQALQCPPDLVLLDMVMPEMDGIETVRQMRQRTELNATRVVGVSATVTDNERKQAFAAACDGFLGKPLQVTGLLQMMERLLQIEWEIVSSAAEADVPLKPPPPEALKAMRRAVDRGEFGELERLVNQHAQDAAGTGFCRAVRQLAAHFDDEGLVALLDRVEKDHNDNGNK
jgi:signal transduction histidine kinase/DNA-binding response OmpR family regulator